MLSINSRFNLVREGSGKMVGRSENTNLRSENTGDTLRIAQIREQLATASPEEREQLASELNSVQERREVVNNTSGNSSAGDQPISGQGGDNQAGAGVNRNPNRRNPTSRGEDLLNEAREQVNSVSKISSSTGPGIVPSEEAINAMKKINTLSHALKTLIDAEFEFVNENKGTTAVTTLKARVATGIADAQKSMEAWMTSAKADMKQKDNPAKPA